MYIMHLKIEKSSPKFTFKLIFPAIAGGFPWFFSAMPEYDWLREGAAQLTTARGV
jgi:hypothetical protein